MIAKTPSLNATNRVVSRDTEAGSAAPGLAPGRSTITSAGCQSQIEDYVVAWL